MNMNHDTAGNLLDAHELEGRGAAWTEERGVTKERRAMREGAAPEGGRGGGRVPLQLADALPAVTDADLGALRARLADDAQARGLLDVAYRTIDTPVGTLLLAATGRGLIRVAYESEDHDGVLAALAARVSPRILNAPARLDAAARELDEYFAGARREFDLPLDRSLSHGFRLEVLSRLPSIGYGHTASYGAVAAAAGNPRAVRAVGTACATNPLPVVVPCHRVVRADGSIGAYLGGPVAKRFLLDLEAAA